MAEALREAVPRGVANLGEAEAFKAACFLGVLYLCIFLLCDCKSERG
jgi:hypothetical protein